MSEEPREATTGRHPGMPRWVKALVALGVLVAVIVVVALIAGGDHGPQRHFGGGVSAAGHSPPPGITHGRQP